MSSRMVHGVHIDILRADCREHIAGAIFLAAIFGAGAVATLYIGQVRLWPVYAAFSFGCAVYAAGVRWVMKRLPR